MHDAVYASSRQHTNRHSHTHTHAYAQRHGNILAAVSFSQIVNGSWDTRVATSVTFICDISVLMEAKILMSLDVDIFFKCLLHKGPVMVQKQHGWLDTVIKDGQGYNGWQPVWRCQCLTRGYLSVFNERSNYFTEALKWSSLKGCWHIRPCLWFKDKAILCSGECSLWYYIFRTLNIACQRCSKENLEISTRALYAFFCLRNPRAHQ